MNKRRICIVTVPFILFTMLAISLRAEIMAGFESWAYSESIEHMSPLLTKIMISITNIGGSNVIIIFCLLLMVIPKSRKTIALPVSITVIISAILNIVLKNIFARERPDILRLINETSYSFPSGHAMNNAAFYTILILIIFKFIKSKPWKTTLSGVCMVLIIAIGLSRIYLGVHYAGDVLGGWLIGFVIAVFIYYIWDSKLLNRKADEPE